MKKILFIQILLLTFTLRAAIPSMNSESPEVTNSPLDTLPRLFQFGKVDKTKRLRNTLPNRNVVTETAINLSQDEVQYQNLMLGGNIISYGISDRFSLSGGFEAFSIVGGESPGLLLSSKYSFKNSVDDLHFAVGANVLSKQDVNSQHSAISFYGLTTFGRGLNNLTFGVGLTRSNGDDRGIVSFHLGGTKRLSTHTVLVTDQGLISMAGDLGFGGATAIRLLWRSFSVDIGLGTDYNTGVIPILGAAYRPRS